MTIKTAPVSLATSTPATTPATTPASKVDPKVEHARFCAAFVVHPATKDKSPKGVASRIARNLNATFGHSCNGGTYYTGADVLALCAREGITLGG